MKMSFLKKTLLTAIFMAAASSSHASLIQVDTLDFQGSGLGNVNTILTIQKSGTETGSVAWNGITDVTTGDNVKDGKAQTQTLTLADLQIASASSLRIVFNAAEPAGNSITLKDLELNIYSPTGTLLFESGTFTPVTFDNTFKGTGSAGFVFALDPKQAAEAQAEAFKDGFGSNRVGLSATVSSAAGGQETFFVANFSLLPLPPSQVPEPGTVALLGLGLFGCAAARRKASK